MPSRFARFCCEVLKEYKVCDRAIQGVRRAESTARAKRYKEPEICRLYPHKEKARVYLPILEWTDSDVERFIAERGIKCHPLYYDEQGNFHVDRRLGCIGCPLQGQTKRRDAFNKYPKILHLYIKNFNIWLNNHKDSKMYKLCDGNPYNKMYYDLFCSSARDFVKKTSEMGRCIFTETETNPQKYLEDYFKIDLTI